MCITFLWLNPDAAEDEFQLVLINNRDELYDRPSAEASFWREDVISGRDMTPNKEGGTWLGVSKTGKIGILFNILEPSTSVEKKGRGSIVVDFLTSDASADDYNESLAASGADYNGFAFLALQPNEKDGQKLWDANYYCNYTGKEEMPELSGGTYAFGNSPRHKPWRKVQFGLQRFQQTLVEHTPVTTKKANAFTDDLLEILKDKTRQFPDQQLQSQAPHLPHECQKALSSCFVEFPAEFRYGTRTHTAVLIDGSNHVTYVEENAQFLPDSSAKSWKRSSTEFDLNFAP